MVEQTHAGEGHGDAVLIALFDDQVITDGATGLCNVLNAGCSTALNGIREREERVRTQSNSIAGIQPCALLLSRQRLRTLGEVVLPNTISANIFFVAVNITVDHIVATGTAQVRTERQIQSLGVLTQEPGISLTASQSDTVDTALLTGTNTDSLSVISKADGIRLT